MPRVMRDVIRITRVMRPPAREPPDGKEKGVEAATVPDAMATSANGLDLAQEFVEWQVIIFVHLLPD